MFLLHHPIWVEEERGRFREHVREEGEKIRKTNKQKTQKTTTNTDKQQQ